MLLQDMNGKGNSKSCVETVHRRFFINRKVEESHVLRRDTWVRFGSRFRSKGSLTGIVFNLFMHQIRGKSVYSCIQIEYRPKDRCFPLEIEVLFMSLPHTWTSRQPQPSNQRSQTTDDRHLCACVLPVRACGCASLVSFTGWRELLAPQTNNRSLPNHSLIRTPPIRYRPTRSNDDGLFQRHPQGGVQGSRER
jgi:hypothetical protein